MNLRISEGQLRFRITRAALESLAQKPPSRKGIEHTQHGLLLALEVDVRPARAGSV